MIARLGGLGRGHRGLRRISPERAKSAHRRAARRQPVEQAGEKLAVAAVAGVIAFVAIGAGADLSPRAWVGLGAILLTAEVFFVRYLLDFRRLAVQALAPVAGIALCLVAPLVATRILFLFQVEDLALLPLSFLSLVMALAWSRTLAIDCSLFSAGMLAVLLALRPDVSEGLHGLAIAFAGALTACLAAEGVKRRAAVVHICVHAWVARGCASVPVRTPACEQSRLGGRVPLRERESQPTVAACPEVVIIEAACGRVPHLARAG